MARARNIKPGFYKNEDLAECSVWARLIFPGLWMLADREGRMEDRPKRIKGELLPYDSVEVDPLLDELVRFGFILRYEVAGQRFIQILKFSEHQTPHVREQASSIPAPEGVEQSTTKAMPRQCLDDDEASPGSPDSLNPSSLNPDSGFQSTAPKAPKYDPRADLLESGVEDQTVTDWLALRKAKKAPVTKTALDAIKREVGKAGMRLGNALVLCCERGWAGFKAEWVQPARASPGYQDKSDKTKAFADALTGRRNDTDPRIIDITPTVATDVD